MVREGLAAASSSASVNPTIIAVKHTSPHTVTIILSGDVSIVSRFCYFDEPFPLDSLPLTLTECQTVQLYQAGRRFLAEKQALVYLNRAEYSVYQLCNKLKKKGYAKHEYQPVLEYLVGEGIADDSRFAAAYIHTRSLSRKEGYARLFSELRKRGVDAHTTKKALCAFFSEVDEAEVCQKALSALIKKGYSEQKLIRSLIAKGFSMSMIKHCMRSHSS